MCPLSSVKDPLHRCITCQCEQLWFEFLSLVLFLSLWLIIANYPLRILPTQSCMFVLLMALYCWSCIVSWGEGHVEGPDEHELKCYSPLHSVGSHHTTMYTAYFRCIPWHKCELTNTLRVFHPVDLMDRCTGQSLTSPLQLQPLREPRCLNSLLCLSNVYLWSDLYSLLS